MKQARVGEVDVSRFAVQFYNLYFDVANIGAFLQKIAPRRPLFRRQFAEIGLALQDFLHLRGADASVLVCKPMRPGGDERAAPARLHNIQKGENLHSGYAASRATRQVNVPILMRNRPVFGVRQGKQYLHIVRKRKGRGVAQEDKATQFRRRSP